MVGRRREEEMDGEEWRGEEEERKREKEQKGRRGGREGREVRDEGKGEGEREGEEMERKEGKIKTASSCKNFDTSTFKLQLGTFIGRLTLGKNPSFIYTVYMSDAKKIF